MSYRIGVDTGGTFTDLIVSGPEGLRLCKAPSTPDDPSRGVFDALNVAAESYKITLQELLSKCEMFVHGSTVGTNAIIQRKTAKTGLICPKGFRSILYIKEGGKTDTFNLKMEYQEPYIPRYLTLPVEERVNSEGEIVVPLREDDVHKAIRQFKEWDVKAIAVSLLWSIRNPAHEQRIAEILQREYPEASYSISSSVLPVIGEYIRTSATAVDSSLKPVIKTYVKKLQENLVANGFSHEFLMVVASGGVLTASQAAEAPVYTVLSGPAMGPLIGFLLGKEMGTGNILTVDMGGTSFDMSIVTDGRIATTRAAKVSGVPTGVNMLDVETIGAGGGSIAWVDPGGLLHVGPQSAGATPGPACYRRGGELPTVTDANMVLGYINPDYFLGGRMNVDPDLSFKAVQEHIAGPLNISAVEAAHAIFRVVNQNMVGGMEEISVRRGLDPREYLMVSGGGATGIHAGKIARDLGVKRALVPKMSGGLCALGMLVGDIKFDHVGSSPTDSVNFDFDQVNQVLDELEKRGQDSLNRERVAEKDRRFEYFVQARYPMQAYTIEIPLRGRRMKPEMLSQLISDFHDQHERTYAVSERNNFVEFSDWRVVATGAIPNVAFSKQAHAGEDSTAARKGERKTYFGEMGGFLDTPIYDGGKLYHGNKVSGPAIIEEPTTTLVVFPGQHVVLNPQGDYLLEIS